MKSNSPHLPRSIVSKDIINMQMQEIEKKEEKVLTNSSRRIISLSEFINKGKARKARVHRFMMLHGKELEKLEKLI